MVVEADGWRKRGSDIDDDRPIGDPGSKSSDPPDISKTIEYLEAYRRRAVGTKPLRLKGTKKPHPLQHRTTQIGAASELMVAAYLLREGWHVYRCMSRVGPVDLIAYKDGVTIYIEVKTEKGCFLQCQPPVTHLAIYDPDTGEVTLRELPPGHYEPDDEKPDRRIEDID